MALLRSVFVEAQSELTGWDARQLALLEARAAYTATLDGLIMAAQTHLRRTHWVNFQGIFTDLINGARMKRSHLLGDTIA